MPEEKIRVLMSKPGIDGHWRGIVVVSRGLRDAGMEVIFGGFQTVEEIVETAIQEDVHMIGLSIHSGAHLKYTQRVADLMQQKGIKDNVMLLVGGAIPKKDVEPLKQIGAANVYGPGSMIRDIVKFIQENIKLKREN
ncbi:MAG: cobalamin B12-binding domain-containing protein [Candidatus Helarchaeales archaeon]